MRILFINLPFSGHVFPTLGLVEELVKNNVAVTYLLTPEWQNKISATGAKFISYENNKKLSTQMRNAYNAALGIAEDFDLIIYEQFFFLGKHLAEKFNKPVIRIFTSLASNEKLMKTYLNSGGMFGIFRSKFICKRWTKQVAHGIPLKTDCWLEEILQNPPDLNLVYTIRAFQPFSEDFSDEHYKFLGASIYKRSEVLDIPLDKNEKPLIYISLGTIFNNSKAFYKKCLAAFEHEKVTVIMSIGKSIKIDSLGKIPDNFLIYPFVPQLDVLNRADVFITHGGLNSITEALYYGVPMVVIPATTDQPANAARIVELKLGKRLNRKSITVENLKNTTMSVMTDDKIRRNVLDIQRKMDTAGGNKYGSDLIISYVSQV